MYDIRFHALITHHSCPFTTTDQALMPTILDAMAIKASACKCFRCGGFDHLVDGCPFPQTALLEVAETTKKGMRVRQAAKSGPSKYTSPAQSDKWFYNGREGCNITSNWTDAHSPIVNEHMSVTTVSRSTLLPDVFLVAQSPLHLNNFCKYLAYHPDQAWCSKLLHGIECGVNISFEGERMSMVSDNWKSALDHPEVIMSILPTR